MLGSSVFGTGKDGLLALRVGLGLSSSSKSLASSASRGFEISFLLLMEFPCATCAKCIFMAMAAWKGAVIL